MASTIRLRHAHVDLLAEEERRSLERRRVERIGAGHIHGPFVFGDDQELVRLGERDRHARRERRGDVGDLEVLHERELGLGRQRAPDRRFVGDARVQGQIDEIDLLLALHGIHPVEAIGRNDPASDEISPRKRCSDIYFSTFSTLRPGALMFMFGAGAGLSESDVVPDAPPRGISSG